LFPDRDSNNPAKETAAHNEKDTGGEQSDSPAIVACNIQQADGAPIVARVQPTAAVQIPPVPCCEPDIPSDALTGESLAGHNAFIQLRWEEFYGDNTEDDSNGWPKASIVGARVCPKHIVGHTGMTHMMKPDLHDSQSCLLMVTDQGSRP
jgi:hypothetical protein